MAKRAGMRGSDARGTGARARLQQLFPGVSDAYEAMALAAKEAGPLDPRSVALLKVALSVGRGSSRGTHAHARKALEAGVTPAELRHLVAVALPTIGLAASLDALRWIEETIDERELEGRDSGIRQPAARRREPLGGRR
jgi:alkylhydroperoxidase/carboxymuconolactone decarboxylase family protein YurZ